MSVNSVAVLRLMGKGGGAIPAGVARGRGSTRGARGVCVCVCVGGLCEGNCVFVSVHVWGGVGDVVCMCAFVWR